MRDPDLKGNNTAGDGIQGCPLASTCACTHMHAHKHTCIFKNDKYTPENISLLFIRMKLENISSEIRQIRLSLVCTMFLLLNISKSVGVLVYSDQKTKGGP